MSDAEVEQALRDVNVIDESNLNDVMLQVADPNEAVSYFQRTIAQNPGRIDLHERFELLGPDEIRRMFLRFHPGQVAGPGQEADCGGGCMEAGHNDARFDQ